MIKRIFFSFFILLFSLFAHIMPVGAAPGDVNDLSSPNFEVSTKLLPSNNAIVAEGDSAVENANFALGIIIQRLMLFIGGFAALIMSIGAGFMIIHRGDDATLSKGKDIFSAGIIGLTVALLSYYMVSILRFIIYS